jgi:hypothetical protein
LAEQVEKIEAAVAELKAKGGTADGLKAAAAGLNGAIDAFDRSFDDRYKAINDFNSDQPVGKPLFG